jgi:hypothetical protein
MTEDTPQVFDSVGAFQMPTDDVIKSLSPDRRKRLSALALAAKNNAAADAELKDATAEQTKAVAANIAAQTTLDKVRPRLTATQAAKDWIAQQHATAARQR